MILFSTRLRVDGDDWVFVCGSQRERGNEACSRVEKSASNDEEQSRTAARSAPKSYGKRPRKVLHLRAFELMERRVVHGPKHWFQTRCTSGNRFLGPGAIVLCDLKLLWTRRGLDETSRRRGRTARRRGTRKQGKDWPGQSRSH